MLSKELVLSASKHEYAVCILITKYDFVEFLVNAFIYFIFNYCLNFIFMSNRHLFYSLKSGFIPVYLSLNSYFEYILFVFMYDSYILNSAIPHRRSTLHMPTCQALCF